MLLNVSSTFLIIVLEFRVVNVLEFRAAMFLNLVAMLLKCP